MKRESPVKFDHARRGSIRSQQRVEDWSSLNPVPISWPGSLLHKGRDNCRNQVGSVGSFLEVREDQAAVIDDAVV